MKKVFITTVILCLFASKTIAQISSPGLGKANSASWFAIGFSEQIKGANDKNWESMTYFGMGRKSNPDNNNPFYKPALLVVNQEFYQQFHKHWKYSFALSYRKENEYSNQFPYEYEDPKWKQEFRAYGRFSYILQTNHIKFEPTFRQEFRWFRAPDFSSADENFQLRTRFRLKLSTYLDAKKIHKISVSSEQLFAISQKNEHWTAFKYTESRFSFYYSYAPKTLPFTIDLGYMKDVVGTKNGFQADYLAADIIFKDLFNTNKQ